MIGGRGPGVGGQLGGRLGWGRGVRRGEGDALEFVKGAVVGALGGVDAALEAREGIERLDEDAAERGVFGVFFDLGELAGPELGFEATETAELPIGVNQGVDEESLNRRSWVELFLISGGEGIEFGGVLAGDNLRFGMDAGFERVETGDGLALRGARPGGVERIAAIRLDLKWRRHYDFPNLRYRSSEDVAGRLGRAC